ncbi:MAG TPA: hypothetical protein VKC89_00490 [Patescibacteria group bacterium]|nr:hypothetical protein [Patescibacteria group bacterium]
MIFLLLILAIILEGSFISIPFVFLFLLFFALKNRSLWVFALAFISGILLDSFFLRNLGQTSIFFLIFLFAVMLYERKFEIASLSFVLISSFVGSFIYFLILGEAFVIPKVLVTCILAFLLSRIFIKQRITSI